MVKSHNVVLKGSDGGAEIHPMKPWLRDHPEQYPEGMGVDNTSHELRRGLAKEGWLLFQQNDRVLVVKPDDAGDTSYADPIIGPSESTETRGEEDSETESDITFGLERDLQTALRGNIEQLESGLKIADDGKERTTDAGRIDICATDCNGTPVVIELKAGIASPDVIAQVLAYMSAVSGDSNKLVRGIVVAGDFHKRVILAARAVPNLELKKYSYRFSFAPVT
jgi:hypothetical protein